MFTLSLSDSFVCSLCDISVRDMRTLRSFYRQTHFLLFDPVETFKSFSFSSRLNYSLSQHLHSTSNLFLSVESSLAVIEDSPKTEPNSSETNVGTDVYNPVTDEIIAEAGMIKRERTYANVKHPNSSHGDETLGSVFGCNDLNDSFRGANTYGSVKNANSSDNDKSYRDGSGSVDGGDDFTKEKAYGTIKSGNSKNVSGQRLDLGDPVGRKKKRKGKGSWVCANCGYSDGHWWVICRACDGVGTIKQVFEGSDSAGGKVGGFGFSENAVRSWLPRHAGKVQPQRLIDVNRVVNQLEWRIPLPGHFGNEVASVLGGGLVPGSLVLIGGDPGVGKSTLLLKMAATISEGTELNGRAPVVYVSGEEGVEQIGNRADGMKIETEELFIYSSSDVEEILAKAHLLTPRALIVDSIQTVYLKDVAGSAGGLSQVKECTSSLLRFAKKTNIPVLLAAHVTKSGYIAGPRTLEHIVDVVLYMEGEEHSSYRLLRSVKNRFGSTDELGVFEMVQSGLRAVSNPSQMFASEHHLDSEFSPGIAVTVVMDGSRSFLIEVQALCLPNSRLSREVNGLQCSRADMIILVLMEQAGLKLEENAIFLHVVGGVKVKDTAGDLAVAAAICSSFFELPIPSGVAFIGEIDLSGELRWVPRMMKRLKMAAKLGYKKCIVPESTEKSLPNLDFEDMKIIGCQNLKDVINAVFMGGTTVP